MTSGWIGRSLWAALVLTWASAAGGQVVSERIGRGAVAMRNADGSVYVGWRLLRGEPRAQGFHVYRQVGDAPPEILTARPIVQSTNFVDAVAPSEGPLRYIVRPDRGGADVEPGATAAVDDGPPGRAYRRIPLRGDYSAQKVAVGDLTGDGRYDFVIKQPNSNVDPYEAPGYWRRSEGTYKLEAYTADGEHLWTHDLGWSIEQGVWYSPYVVYDLDGDGRAEVYLKSGEGDPRGPDGRVATGPEWLVRLDGRTGQQTARVPWPDRQGYNKYNYASRNLMGVAYLDGNGPSLIVVRGTYTLIKVEAFDAELKSIWKWSSASEPGGGYSGGYAGQGSHGLHVADVDGDGRDEIILGAAALSADGKGLWTTRLGHPDVCYVGEIDPANPGLEVFYGIEPSKPRNGVCLVDARTGRILWGFDGPTSHVHGQGGVADVLPEHPGQECYAGEKDGSQYWLYAADGTRIGNRKLTGLNLNACWWDDGPQKALIDGEGIRRFGGDVHTPLTDQGRLVLVGDILGDWREELVYSHPGELRIYTTTIPSQTRRLCLMQDRLYRLGVVTASMGYYYQPQLSSSLGDQ